LKLRLMVALLTLALILGDLTADAFKIEII
jgi:hypothetical protein